MNFKNFVMWDKPDFNIGWDWAEPISFPTYLPADIEVVQSVMKTIKDAQDQLEYEEWCRQGMPGLIRL
jgi:hypothetical protein